MKAFNDQMQFKDMHFWWRFNEEGSLYRDHKTKKNKVFSHGNSVFWELTYVIVKKVSRNENIKRNVYSKLIQNSGTYSTNLS